MYRRLFSDQAIDTRELLHGREHLLESARSVLQDRRAGRLRAVAVVGLSGTGKRAVIQALRRGFDAQRVIEHTADAPVSAATVQGWFDGTEGRLHLVDDVQWLFSLAPGGLSPIRALIRGIVEDRGRNAWLLRIDEPLWHALLPLTAIEHALPTLVHLDPLDSADLQRAVRARHDMSGHALGFEPGAHAGESASPLSTDEAAEQRWFDGLHAASNGIIRDALNLWAASVTHIDEDGGEVRVGRIPSPPFDAIRQLDDRTLLLLRLGMRQGWLTSPLVAGAFGIDTDEAQARLAELVHRGLLRASEQAFELPEHLVGPIHRVLSERRWA